MLGYSGWSGGVVKEERSHQGLLLGNQHLDKFWIGLESCPEARPNRTFVYGLSGSDSPRVTALMYLVCPLVGSNLDLWRYQSSLPIPTPAACTLPKNFSLQRSGYRACRTLPA